MAQNEMKAKPALPERVRSMEGLGGAGGTAALALAAETLAEPERRATLRIGVVLTSRSVPELSPVRHRLGVPILVLPIEVVVLCSSEFPARSLAVNSEQVV